ncbi:hypothetical protein ABIA16_004577 [Sinorhizobium fredii]
MRLPDMMAEVLASAGEAYTHRYLRQCQLLAQVLAVGEQCADGRFGVAVVPSKR